MSKRASLFPVLYQIAGVLLLAGDHYTEGQRARLTTLLLDVLSEPGRYTPKVVRGLRDEALEAMTAYFKATRFDGTDFHSGTIDYAAALESGEVVRHPAKSKVRDDPETYLSVSVNAADCTGFSWPCRLFRVEPVGRVMANLAASPNKRAVSALRVVEELPAWQAFGPNGEQVVAFIERCSGLTPDEVRRLYIAWAAARDAVRAAAWAAAWAAAREAARAAAWDAAGAAAWDAAGAAARALVVRDRISPVHYATLTRPFVDAGLEAWVA